MTPIVCHFRLNYALEVMFPIIILRGNLSLLFATKSCALIVAKMDTYLHLIFRGNHRQRMLRSWNACLVLADTLGIFFSYSGGQGQLLWKEFNYFSGYTIPNFDKMAGNPVVRQVMDEVFHAYFRFRERNCQTSSRFRKKIEQFHIFPLSLRNA